MDQSGRAQVYYGRQLISNLGVSRDDKKQRDRNGDNTQMMCTIQCVSLDSTSLIIYPEIKATEAPFQN